MTRDGAHTRRAYLRRALAGTAVGLAGCSYLETGDESTPAADDGGGSGTAAPEDTPTATPANETATATPTETETPTATPTPAQFADVSGSVTAYRYDARRRAYAADVTGPAEDVAAAYEVSLGGSAWQPVIDGTRLYLARRDRRGGEPTHLAYDLRRGTKEWELTLDGGAGTAPTIVDGTLYVQSRHGLHAIDEDGNVEWEVAERAIGAFAPAVVDDTLFVLGRNSVAAYDAGGDEQWSIPLTNRPLAAPAATSDRVFFTVPRSRNEVDVFAREPLTGRTDWRASAPAASGLPPVVADGTVYVTDDRRGITALAATSGERAWHTEREVDGTPTVTDGYVVFRQGSAVTALTKAAGDEAWTVDLGDSIVAGPVAGSDRVYVGIETDEGTGILHAIDPGSGSIEYTHATDAPLASLPAVVDGGLVGVTEAPDGTASLLVLVEG